jgi:hypothetical protein
LFSPYKDVTADANWNTGAMQSSVTGTSESVTSAMPSKDTTLSWAFATGSCGSETWAGITPAMIASNVSTFVNAGKKYIVSTGGADGSFSCSSDSGFDTFINTYNSNNLVGIDFDIEGGQSQTVINNLVTRVKNAQSKYPGLRFSFTIATLATSNGSSSAVNMGSSSPNPLGSYGIMVMSHSIGRTQQLLRQPDDNGLRQRISRQLRGKRRRMRNGPIGNSSGNGLQQLLSCSI